MPVTIGTRLRPCEIIAPIATQISFSLGVILYEMVTGDRPFKGDTSISIISSIAKDTPASLTEINPALPRDLARIVRRALAKDPEKRCQTATDLRNDLEELNASPDSGELIAASTRGGAITELGVVSARMVRDNWAAQDAVSDRGRFNGLTQFERPRGLRSLVSC